MDDYDNTARVLDPSPGSISFVTWVKGGIAGQVIVSQIGGVDWLCADPSDGRLMTSLGPPPSRTVPPPLLSELTITDGNDTGANRSTGTAGHQKETKRPI